MTVGSAIWRDQLTAARSGPRSAATTAASAASGPTCWSSAAGSSGVATAAACHEAGLGSVLLIEAGRLGAGPPAGPLGCSSPSRTSGATPSRSWTWSGPAWNGGVTWSSRCPAGSAWSSWTGSGWPRTRAASPPHQPPAVEWLDPGQVAELVPGLARPMAGRADPAPGPGQPAAGGGPAGRRAARGGHRRRRHRGDHPRRPGRPRSPPPPARSIPGAVVFATGQPPVLDGLHAGRAVRPGQGPPAGHRARRRCSCRASWRRWPPRWRTARLLAAAPSTSATRARRSGRK